MAKRETYYRITCDVPTSGLTTVMQVLEGAGTIVEVRQAPAATSEPGKPPRQMKYAGGKKNKGISSQDLVVELCSQKKRAVTREELTATFVARGFSANSVSPAVSQLTAAKRIAVDDRGRVTLVSGV